MLSQQPGCVRGLDPDELVARPPVLSEDLPQPSGVGTVHRLDDLSPLLHVERDDHIDVWCVLHGGRDIPALLQDPGSAAE